MLLAAAAAATDALIPGLTCVLDPREDRLTAISTAAMAAFRAISRLRIHAHCQYEACDDEQSCMQWNAQEASWWSGQAPTSDSKASPPSTSSVPAATSKVGLVVEASRM
eukprot:scaffold257837_cov33-Tisochrysis_lutea.AAC.6